MAEDELENRHLKFGPELVGIASDLCVRLDEFKPPSLLKNSKRLPVLSCHSASLEVSIIPVHEYASCTSRMS